MNIISAFKFEVEVSEIWGYATNEYAGEDDVLEQIKRDSHSVSKNAVIDIDSIDTIVKMQTTDNTTRKQTTKVNTWIHLKSGATIECDESESYKEIILFWVSATEELKPIEDVKK